MAGLLVTIEGGEGAGKTTQAALRAGRLAADGHDVLRTREPGGAPGAEALRGFLLARARGQGKGLSVRSEAMVHFAARIDHVEQTIAPALQAGRLVLCDRFSDSTLAYQGYGLGHGDPEILAFIGRLSGLVPVRPRITLVLDVAPDEARRRLRQRGGAGDRYEVLDDAFHARVADGFRAIARGEPERCVVVSSAGTIDAVHQRLLAAVAPILAA